MNPRVWNQMIRFLRHFDTVISVCLSSFRVLEMVLRCRGMCLLTILTSKLSPEAPWVMEWTEWTKMIFFSKTRRIAPKTGRNRLVLTLIVFLKSLVALALPERPLETWFHFRIKKLIPEYPRMWNQMIRFLRHFDRSFQSVKVVTHTD